jgi:hypothetical protein
MSQRRAGFACRLEIVVSFSAIFLMAFTKPNPTRRKTMRMLMQIKMPLEPFNAAVREGTIGKKMQRIMEAMKPEAAYFSEQDGHRGGVLVVDVKDPSDVPRLAEPWFLTFNASVEFRVAMTPEDLGRAGLEELGKTWG